MQTPLPILREQVLEATRASSVSAKVRDVLLEEGRDNEGGEFIRVIVQVKDSDQADDAALEALLEAIEDAVGGLDERYPSVRFLDAAE